MTDLLDALPAFHIAQYTHLLPSLEKNYITTNDLLTLDGIEVAKRAQLPPLEVKRLIAHVLAHLQAELGIRQHDESHNGVKRFEDVPAHGEPGYGKLSQNGQDLLKDPWSTISLGDETLDSALGGGIPTGYITELVGESGAAKTQLLVTLLLTVQLSAPQGLERPALYISTEHALPTSRLTQLIRSHPLLLSQPPSSRPSLSKILSKTTTDLEEQDHIIQYQLPIALARHNIGLVVIDSIAAHYRAEKTSSSATARGENNRAKALAERSGQIIKLCATLRKLAREYDCAIVVANQVSDRFSPINAPPPSSASNPNRSPPLATQGGMPVGHWSSSPAAPSQNMPNIDAMMDNAPRPPPALNLDHQLRWFTGWGDAPPYYGQRTSFNDKTPALGLTWANQIDCRIALIKEERITHQIGGEVGPVSTSGTGNQKAVEWAPRRWKRYMRVVFAPWAKGSGEGEKGVEFEVWEGGVRAIGS